MEHSRSTRKESERTQRRKGLVVAAVAVVAAALALVGVWAAFASSATEPIAQDLTLESQLSSATTDSVAIPASDVESTAPMVEVPDVSGDSLGEARIVLSALGLTVETVEDASQQTGDAGDDRTVLAQAPGPRALVDPGSAVTLTVPRSAKSSAPEAVSTGYVVCIDPGHQSKSDPKREPIGPGSSETKARVTGGTQGVVTGVPEYEIVLQIANNLKAELEERGVTVVMTRDENDVNISNSERAEVANQARADLFVRVHADGSADSNVSGISTLYPAKNQWTGAILADSTRAAQAVQDGMIAATGASSKGIVARDDISGFNWSKVPAVLVECGFMSNPVEDRLLSSAHYQDKLARGIADGVMVYLEEE
jgi:N-acetylmuramoyl-L-alanine amidase